MLVSDVSRTVGSQVTGYDLQLSVDMREYDLHLV
jgi:hypothetical protein